MSLNAALLPFLPPPTPTPLCTCSMLLVLFFSFCCMLCVSSCTEYAGRRLISATIMLAKICWYITTGWCGYFHCLFSLVYKFISADTCSIHVCMHIVFHDWSVVIYFLIVVCNGPITAVLSCSSVCMSKAYP